MSRAKPYAHRVVEALAAQSELHRIFTAAGEQPVFPKLHNERYSAPPLQRDAIVLRVCEAVNRCEHAPSFSTSTVKLKLLTSLAKDGRAESSSAFAQFTPEQMLGPPPPSVLGSHSAGPSGPRIATFREEGKHEADVQREYQQAKNEHNSAQRSQQRAERRHLD